MPLPESPTVGVVVISYNNRPFLSTCLDSVLNQTYLPEQVVVCDDASTDGTQDVLREYEDRHPNRITTVLHETNGGIAANLNSGLRRMEADLVSLVAGDDKWAPDKVEREVQALQRHTESRWAYSACRNIDADGNDIGEFRRKHDGAEGEILYEVLTHKMTLRNWMAERSLIEEVGFFDESLEIFEDWDYKIRLATIASVTFVDKETVFYRMVDGSASSSRPIIYAKNLEKIYAKMGNLDGRICSQKKYKIDKIKNKDIIRFYKNAFDKSMNEKRYREAVESLRKLLEYKKRVSLRMIAKLVFYPFLQVMNAR